MSARVEIAKAAVSVSAVLVDGKVLTVAMFEKLPIVGIDECWQAECASLGVVDRRSRCHPKKCGRRHNKWALVAKRKGFPDETGADNPVLVRINADQCMLIYFCARHHAFACEKRTCREDAHAMFQAGWRHFKAQPVYLAP